MDVRENSNEDITITHEKRKAMWGMYMLVPGQYEQVPVMKCSVRSVDTMVVDVYRNGMRLGDLVLFLLPPCPFKNR